MEEMVCVYFLAKAFQATGVYYFDETAAAFKT